MNAVQKLEVLKDVYSDENELDQILGKLLDVALSRHRQRLARYQREMRHFEERYEMESATFYRRFEDGELGDAMDFFEWAGLYELFRYRLVLDDDSLLETFERFQLVAGEVQVTKFSFHWQSAEGQLYKRWKRDSMGHYLVTGCAGFLDITNRNSPLVSVG
jgi:hypothetical protein